MGHHIGGLVRCYKNPFFAGPLSVQDTKNVFSVIVNLFPLWQLNVLAVFRLNWTNLFMVD